MSAVQPWMDQMDGVVDGWWTATMSQQGCDVSHGERTGWEFLTEYFLPWHRKKNRASRNKIISMHDSAPSHAARNTSASLAAMGIRGEKLPHPPLTSTLLRNFGRILKEQIYEGGRQFPSKQQLWEAILTSCKEIQAETLQKLTSSMDARIVKLLSNKGSYVNM